MKSITLVYRKCCQDMSLVCENLFTAFKLCLLSGLAAFLTVLYISFLTLVLSIVYERWVLSMTEPAFLQKACFLNTNLASFSSFSLITDCLTPTYSQTVQQNLIEQVTSVRGLCSHKTRYFYQHWKEISPSFLEVSSDRNRDFLCKL